MLRDFAKNELGAEIYPEVTALGEGKAEILYDSPRMGLMRLGTLARNKYDLWPVKTGIGAIDLYMSQAITEIEARWKAPKFITTPKKAKQAISV